MDTEPTSEQARQEATINGCAAIVVVVGIVFAVVFTVSKFFSDDRPSTRTETGSTPTETVPHHHPTNQKMG